MLQTQTSLYSAEHSNLPKKTVVSRGLNSFYCTSVSISFQHLAELPHNFKGAIKWSGNGKCLAISSLLETGIRRSSICCYDSTKPGFPKTSEVCVYYVITTISLNATGTTLIAATSQDTILIWQRNTPYSQWWAPNAIYVTQLTEMADVSPDGKLVAAICMDGSVRFWSININECNVLTIELVNSSPFNQTLCHECHFSPDGLFFAVGCTLFVVHSFSLCNMPPLLENQYGISAWSGDSSICAFLLESQPQSLIITQSNTTSVVQIAQSRELPSFINSSKWITVNESGNLFGVSYKRDCMIINKSGKTLAKIDSAWGSSCIFSPAKFNSNVLVLHTARQPSVVLQISFLPSWKELRPLLAGWKKCNSPLSLLPIEILEYIVELAWGCSLPNHLVL